MRTIASFSVVLIMTNIFLANSGGAESARAKLPDDRNGLMPECEMVYEEFPSCLDFLTGVTDTVDAKCCSSIYELNKAAKFGVGAPTICRCIEAIAKDLEPPLLYFQISKLPSECTTHLSFPISEAMNCSVDHSKYQLSVMPPPHGP